jgi:magnesium-transporting ATPase (P-type)
MSSAPEAPDDDLASRAHALADADVLAAMEVTPQGLTGDEARRRLLRYGANQLPAAHRRGPLMRFALQFHNVLIYVLLGSAFITAMLQHWTDTIVIVAVVVANALLGFIQEGRSEKAMDSVRSMLAPMASVMRDGERTAIRSEELVPGDVVLVEAGDKIPADVRLLRTHAVTVEEAILTGESVPVTKEVPPVPIDAALGDRRCMGYSGTLVASGQAQAVVVATGLRTQIGRISGLLSGVTMLDTPLIRQMGAFAQWLTGVILAVAFLLLLYGYLVQGHAFAELFMAVVGLSVAAIPEGLPAVLTITMAIGVRAMARRNAIVRRLPAIETIGAVSVICTDKTGTLTTNEMMVASLVVAGARIDVSGTGYAPDGHLAREGQRCKAEDIPVHGTVARAAALCNDADLREHEATWRVHGDPMEGALLTLVRKLGLDEREERRDWKRTDAIPFDARHRFMATLSHDHAGHAAIHVKGAPEAVLEMCATQLDVDGNERPVDRAGWQAAYEAIAARGQRVLALAMRVVEPEKTTLTQHDIRGSLSLIGLVGLMDPPRPEAVAAVTECRQAGIRVKMITGDHAGTAAAIAAQVGLEHPQPVLTGADLDRMSDAELAVAVLGTDVFARTSPEHKLRLVMALQANGHVTAMTGDGVNDAPALKRADAGIAMGLKGTEAAKEASELVLADDNFASIVAAVREGRTVYDNIKKVLGWTLPTNSGEAMTIIVALLLGLTLPVTPVQILWINLVTAITLGIALTFEPTEIRTMQRPPRRKNEPLISGTLIWHIVLVSFLFLGGVYGIYTYAIGKGHGVDLARTMAVNTLVVMEIFHLFFMRNFYSTSLTLRAVAGTPMVWLTVSLVTAAQFAFTYVPFLQKAMGSVAVPFVDGLIIVGVGVALFAVIEIEKQVRLRAGGWVAMRGAQPR